MDRIDQLSPEARAELRLRDDERIAVEDDEGIWTYASLHARASRIARALLAETTAGSPGSRSLEGERVALFVAPGGNFVAAFFGVLMAGGVVTVLSPLHPPREMLFFCDDAKVRTVIVSPDWLPRAEEVAKTRHLLRTDDARFSGEDLAPNAEALPAIAPDSPALQLYTSGTTGKPKGAVLTHRNLVVQQRLLARAWEFSEGDVLLHALPLHHMHGLAIALLTALGAGAAIRMLPAFDASRIWNTLPRATVFMAVPTMYTRLLAAFDAAEPKLQATWERGARELRLATSGSAALPSTLAERWQKIAGAIPVERFGMTEIGVGMTNPVRGARKPGHVGLPLPTVQTRIVDDDGRDAESGELWIAGPSVFLGYYERPDATGEAFVVDAETGTSWFRTGDTVARDADGYFKILGRTSVDILKSGGYKLSALEIEEVLREHPAIREVAVVGIPDEDWGDRVIACVVPHEARGDECTTTQVRAFAKERLAPYKVPKEVALLDELPRNAMGKVQKPQLSAWLLSAKGSRAR